MQISIIAIGKMAKGPEKSLLETYCKRLPWKIDVLEFEMKKKAANVAEQKAQEAEKLLAAVPDGAMVIALDERGKALTSRGLAEQVDRWQMEGVRDIAFIIGGADGLDETIRQKAHLKLAFGTLTWPHMLVRAMLAEQVYRVWSILHGHPYHRD
ncbi:ribosomal RNA large subunit methyltransferase H [Kordiimonas sediminis]|uniref:Ribosomal RNA large subunit methyltransferase H n=1 Tax=Kordiimonas sediminis TaxID=1735581 RepID=A0A919E750_9PROT|nr:23S rRNA (pseudouridine(1915)-N(3))-methyltransferase RlmH [Kordiimonas sediminis]GHF20428.1 ribosomal RNA large subunit methyltransferase H [Kordiimonas sediminis]